MVAKFSRMRPETVEALLRLLEIGLASAKGAKGAGGPKTRALITTLELLVKAGNTALNMKRHNLHVLEGTKA